MKKRVALLTNTSRSAEALAHVIARSQLELVLVVSELDPVAPPALGIRGVIRRIFGNATVNRMNVLRGPRKVRDVLSVENVLKHSADIQLEEELRAMDIAQGWPDGVPHLFTVSCNAPSCVEQVVAAKADLILVFGTSVLKQGILGAASHGALNAHTSILPAYRGSRSEFWQCYHNDREHVGITIHRIDPGVDTGDILFQHHTATQWPSDPYSLRSRNTIEVLSHFPQVADDLLHGRITAIKQGPSDQPTFRNRDITLEKRLALFGRFSL